MVVTVLGGGGSGQGLITLGSINIKSLSISSPWEWVSLECHSGFLPSLTTLSFIGQHPDLTDLQGNFTFSE